MDPETLKRLFPNASASTIKRNLGGNDEGVYPNQPQRAERSALDVPPKRKAKGRARTVQCAERYRIVFHVYSLRPFDWDNYSTKELQDIIVRTGILPSDSWRVLEGSVVAHKAEAPEDERTVVEITRIT